MDGAEKSEELAAWPSRNRRHLEARWLEALEGGAQPPVSDPGPPPPPELREAVELFNAGLFWECHEALEDLWRATPYPRRFFYHAVIKAAVGLHHLGRRNRRGARAKLADALRLLALFQPAFMGLDTQGLGEQLAPRLALLEVEGPVDWRALEAMGPPVVRLEG